MKKVILIGVMASMSILSVLHASKNEDLWNAAKGGDVKKVETALKGADINYVHKGGMTPLMIACAQGHGAVVALLLERGANVNYKAAGGYTALSYAIGSRKSSIVKQLLDTTDFINTEYEGQTPLEHLQEKCETDKKYESEYKKMIRYLKAVGVTESKEAQETE